MFLMREGVTDQYRGLPVFSEELERIEGWLERRRQRLAEQGISYYLTIAPMKATMYRDKMPGGSARWPVGQDRSTAGAPGSAPRTVHRPPGTAPGGTHRAGHLPRHRHPLEPWGAFAGY